MLRYWGFALVCKLCLKRVKKMAYAMVLAF